MCVAMAQRVFVRSLLLVLAVSAVAADELSEGPGQLVCPPDQDSNSSYWFTLPIPSDCNKSPIIQCSYYLAVRRNPVDGSFADFHLSATAHGYVAVGFSRDKLMGEDDVIGCKRDPQTGNISVVSAWNPAPQHAPNIRDPSQRGVCQYYTSYSDGQLSCRFSRYIAPVNPGRDYDLNNSYYLFLTRSDNGSSPHFLKHKETPIISHSPINVLHDNSTAGQKPRSALVKAHGAMMLLACPFLYGFVVLFGVPLIKSISIQNYLSRKDIWHLLRITLGIGIICFMVLGTLFAVVGNTSILCNANIFHVVKGSLMLVTVLAMVLLDCCLVCFDFQLTCVFLVWWYVLVIEDFFIPFSLLLSQDGCGTDRPDFVIDVLIVHLVLKLVLFLVIVALYIAFICYRWSEPNWSLLSYWQNFKKVVGFLIGVFAIVFFVNVVTVLTLVILFSFNP